MVNILNNSLPKLSNAISNQMISTYNIIKDAEASKVIVPSSKGEAVKQSGEPSRSFFSIQYFDANGDPKYFNFSLLPAINPGIQGSSGMSVPGAGPGIKIKSKMKHRSITIPGSTPVIQTIGVENTVIELVGIFTGFEKSFSDTKTYLNDSLGYLASSADVSAVFRYEVLQPGTPVQLSIKASSGYVQDSTGSFIPDTNEKSISVESKILITDFEELLRQFDRSYFYIRAFVLTYPNTKRKDPKDPSLPKPVAFKSAPSPKTISQVSPSQNSPATSTTPADPKKPTTPAKPAGPTKPPTPPVR